MTDQARTPTNGIDPFPDPPRYVIVRICSCGAVSLRDGDSDGDAVNLPASTAHPLLDAISTAFTPVEAPTMSSSGCFDCLGSLAAGRPPAKGNRRDERAHSDGPGARGAETILAHAQ